MEIENCVVCKKYLNNIGEQEQAMCNKCDIETEAIAKEQNQALILHSVTCSFDLAKANQAIELIKNAESESDVLDALYVKEKLNWLAVTDDIKDLWNEYYGDLKRYLP
jgi:NMD protein affecting ribosome stability and mRNA decay